MADNTTSYSMAAAGFSQSPPPSGFVQAPPQFVQAPQPIQLVVPQPLPPVSTGNATSSSFSSIIQDNSGGVSSIRCLMLLWGVGVFLIWSAGAIVGLVHGIYVFPTIPAEVVTILLGVSGIKTIQRFGEK